MQSIIVVIFLAGLLFAGLLLLALFLIRKCLLKRRWSREQKEFAESGTLSPRRNHDSVSVDTIVTVICLAVLLLVTVLVVNSGVTQLQDTLAKTEQSLSESLQALQEQQIELTNLQLRQASLLSDFTVEFTDYDASAHTATAKVTVRPKAVTADTAVTLVCGEKTFATERYGAAFQASLQMNIFDSFCPSGQIKVLLGNGDGTQTETVSETLFSETARLILPNYSNIIPSVFGFAFHINNADSQIQYSPIHVLSGTLYGIADVTPSDFRLYLTLNGNAVCEKAVTDVTVEDYGSKGKEYILQAPTLEMPKLGKTDEMQIFLLYSLSTGETVKTLLYTATAKTTTSTRVTTLIGSDGTVLYTEHLN